MLADQHLSQAIQSSPCPILLPPLTSLPPPATFFASETLHRIPLAPLSAFVSTLRRPEHLLKLHDILDRYRTPKSYHRVDVREVGSSELPWETDAEDVAGDQGGEDGDEGKGVKKEGMPGEGSTAGVGLGPGAGADPSDGRERANRAGAGAGSAAATEAEAEAGLKGGGGEEADASALQEQDGKRTPKANGHVESTVKGAERADTANASPLTRARREWEERERGRPVILSTEEEMVEYIAQRKGTCPSPVKMVLSGTKGAVPLEQKDTEGAAVRSARETETRGSGEADGTSDPEGRKVDMVSSSAPGQASPLQQSQLVASPTEAAGSAPERVAPQADALEPNRETFVIPPLPTTQIDTPPRESGASPALAPNIHPTVSISAGESILPDQSIPPLPTVPITPATPSLPTDTLVVKSHALSLPAPPPHPAAAHPPPPPSPSQPLTLMPTAPKRRVRELRLDLRTLDAAALFQLEVWRRATLGIEPLEMALPDSVWFQAPPTPTPSPSPPPAKRKRGRPPKVRREPEAGVEAQMRPAKPQEKDEAVAAEKTAGLEEDAMEVVSGGSANGQGTPGAGGEPDLSSRSPTPELLPNTATRAESEDSDFVPPPSPPAVRRGRRSRANMAASASASGTPAREAVTMRATPVQRAEVSSPAFSDRATRASRVSEVSAVAVGPAGGIPSAKRRGRPPRRAPSPAPDAGADAHTEDAGGDGQETIQAIGSPLDATARSLKHAAQLAPPREKRRISLQGAVTVLSSPSPDKGFSPLKPSPPAPALARQAKRPRTSRAGKIEGGEDPVQTRSTRSSKGGAGARGTTRDTAMLLSETPSLSPPPPPRATRSSARVSVGTGESAGVGVGRRGRSAVSPVKANGTAIFAGGRGTGVKGGKAQGAAVHGDLSSASPESGSREGVNQSGSGSGSGVGAGSSSGQGSELDGTMEVDEISGEVDQVEDVGVMFVDEDESSSEEEEQIEERVQGEDDEWGFLRGM